MPTAFQHAWQLVTRRVDDDCDALKARRRWRRPWRVRGRAARRGSRLAVLLHRGGRARHVGGRHRRRLSAAHARARLLLLSPGAPLCAAARAPNASQSTSRRSSISTESSASCRARYATDASKCASKCARRQLTSLSRCAAWRRRSWPRLRFASRCTADICSCLRWATPARAACRLASRWRPFTCIDAKSTARRRVSSKCALMRRRGCALMRRRCCAALIARALSLSLCQITESFLGARPSTTQFVVTQRVPKTSKELRQVACVRARSTRTAAPVGVRLTAAAARVCV